MKDVRRGYCEEDAVLFGRKAMAELCECARDITYLLNRGYPFKNAVTFTGNHYQLAKRQRDALMRACASDEMVRKNSLHVFLKAVRFMWTDSMRLC